MNKVILIGNVGKAPELRYTPQGIAEARFSMATHWDRWGADDSRKRVITEWHRIACIGNLAHVAVRLTRGELVNIEGRIHYYTDKAGLFATVIVAERLGFLAKPAVGVVAPEAEEPKQ